MDKQAKFRDKYQLNMPLLADSGKEVATEYGAYKEKLERTTFIIGKDGTIKTIFPKVKVEGHVEEVLKALDSIA